MNLDSCFFIGSSHIVCEDYARHGVYEQGGMKIGWMIVCDGCSTSERTDFGARLLVHQFELEVSTVLPALMEAHEKVTDQYLYTVLRQIYDNVIRRATRDCEHLQLTPNSLFASIVIFLRIERDKMRPINLASVFGDGYIIVEDRDRLITMFQYYYMTNAPYYLAYTQNPEANTYYRREFGNSVELKTRIFSSEDYSHVHMSQTKVSIDRLYYVNIAPDAARVIICTDGLESFYRTDGGKRHNVYDTEAFFKELYPVKEISAGSFLKRRIKSYYRKNETGMMHSDDLGIAMYVSDDQP